MSRYLAWWIAFVFAAEVVAPLCAVADYVRLAGVWPVWPGLTGCHR